MEEKRVAGHELRPITALIKQHNVSISTRKLNDLLMQNAYLEERTRPSTTDPSKTKSFKALTEKGLEFGENVGNDYTDETQPRYYADSFPELVARLTKNPS